MYALREITQSDIPAINRWRNDPNLVGLLCTPYRYVNQEVDEQWFNLYLSSRHNTVRCAMIQKENPQSILGVAYLTDIDLIYRKGVSGIMIGDPDYRGKGLGAFALNELLRHAFFNMNLHRVECNILTYNKASLALHKKIGYQQEGISRESAYKDGKYVDLVHLGILRQDYLYRNNEIRKIIG